MENALGTPRLLYMVSEPVIRTEKKNATIATPIGCCLPRSAIITAINPYPGDIPSIRTCWTQETSIPPAIPASPPLIARVTRTLFVMFIPA